MPDTSGPAFSMPGSVNANGDAVNYPQYGMSKRELMATAIAGGIASKFGDFALSGRSDLIADAAVNIADALIARLRP